MTTATTGAFLVPAFGFIEFMGTMLYLGMAITVLTCVVRRIVMAATWPIIGWLLAIVVVLPVAAASADFGHFLLMRRCYSNWNGAITRDADGVREGCAAFEMGQGDDAMLLVHGFADSPAVYRRMASVLAANSFKVKAMRLPFFAQDWAAYSRSSRSLWCEALRSELSALKQNHRRVIVVAHSLGAAVAIDALAGQSSACDGLVLLAPLIGISDRRSPLVSPAVWFRLLDRVVIFSDRVAIPFPQDCYDPAAASMLVDDRFVPRNIYRELFSLIARNEYRAAEIEMPLYMVLAATDKVVDNASAESFFNRCGSRVKRLQRVEGCGHVLPMDHGWESLANDVARFAADHRK